MRVNWHGSIKYQASSSWLSEWERFLAPSFNSKTLGIKLRVNFGDHQRNILAGIKTGRIQPSEVVGLQALFVVNLEHREMMGEVSEGMLFDIGYADDITPVLAVPERPVPNGARAG